MVTGAIPKANIGTQHDLSFEPSRGALRFWECLGLD